MNQEIYLDHAATTYLLPEVLEAMFPYFTENYANTQSIHDKGKQALIALDQAKDNISKTLNCRSRELIFTSGGTEANFLATVGFAQANHQKGKHIISTTIEHPSNQKALEKLEAQGFKITYLKPDHQGLISPQELDKAITPKTILVSIIHAHNEIGTIQDTNKLHQITKQHNIPLHLDCCQSPNTEDLSQIQAEMITINASKIYGPKGIGLLKKQQDIRLSPEITHQGTANLPSIIGLAKALEIAQLHHKKNKQKFHTQSQILLQTLQQALPNITLNGHPTQRLSNNLNLIIPNLSGQELLLKLSDEKIYISTGSACNFTSNKPSKTLQEIGLNKPQIHSTIRITLGHRNTPQQIKHAAETIIKIALEKQKNRSIPL